MKAHLKFLANLDEPLVYIPSKGGGDETDHVGNFAMQEVSVHDGRRDKSSASLDVEGFRLANEDTQGAITALATAIDLNPKLKDQAAKDSDLNALRKDD